MDILQNKNETAVIVVDLQADFTELKNGALAVDGTDGTYLAKMIEATIGFKDKGYSIFATQDFHPQNHISFYTNHEGKAPYDTIEIDGRTQVLWPPHCIQGTEKAQILLQENLFSVIVQKGMDPKFDSYSGFFDDGGASTGMHDILKSSQVTTLIIYGLALDYCVKFTALDAVKLGYRVIVMPDLCKGVAKDTSELAVKEMRDAGILFDSDVL